MSTRGNFSLLFFNMNLTLSKARVEKVAYFVESKRHHRVSKMQIDDMIRYHSELPLSICS